MLKYQPNTSQLLTVKLNILKDILKRLASDGALGMSDASKCNFLFFCSATLCIFPIWFSNHPVCPSRTLHNLEINVFLFSGRGEIPRTPVLWTNAFMSPFRRAVWLDNKHNREGRFTASKNGPAPPSGTALTSRLSLQVSHQILKYVRKWCRAPAAWTLCVVQ